MEAVRGFLVGKNDAGELNLNKLCLVGVGMGATVAVNWAAQDWDAPPLLVGKQGQDVKALVLVSPQLEIPRRSAAAGVAAAADLKQQRGLDVDLWRSESGTGDRRQRIYRQLERYHPEPSIGSSTAAKPGVVAVSFGTGREWRC